MMSAFANSLQKPDRFDLYVRKFRATCGLHGIQMGSRSDLPGFLERVVDDRAFGMDFWKLIGKLSDREGGELSDDQVLAVIVEGVTGDDRSEEDGEVKQTVDSLRALLAGVDVQGPGQGQVELAPFPRSEADPVPRDADPLPRDKEAGIHAVELPLRPVYSRVSFMPEAFDGRADPTAASSAVRPQQLDEERLRLEVARLVREYFDNLDKSKLENSGGAASIASAMIRRSLEEQDPKSNSRLVLEPDVSPGEFSFVPKHDDPSIRVPLADYSPSGGYGKVVLVAILLVVLFEGGFEAYGHRAALRAEFASLVDKVQSKAQVASANQSATPIRPSGRDLLRDLAEQSRPATEPLALQSPSTPPPPAAETSTTPAQVASVGPRVVGGDYDSSNNPKTTIDHEVVRSEQAFPDGISNADLARAIRVAPAAMESNLVVSRVPAYPEVAKENRIQGPVVMQAIISKNGFVKRVHVTEGDSRLRSAATEAAYKRLYRPYILNGKPVEVATTITVDFHLDR
jgi:outer membrane biosynthesis protein TonB